MKSKTEKLLRFMNVLAWIACIGLLIKTGTILFNYFLSIQNEAAAENLFGGLNLLEYRNHSFLQYTFIVSYKVALFALEAYIAFLVIKLLGGLNLQKPFNTSTQKLTEKISYSVFYLWIIAMIHNAHVQYIGKKYEFSMDLFSSDFVFLAAMIFIFAKIMQRGIELQAENELTI
jgi:hypothetical protein